MSARLLLAIAVLVGLTAFAPAPLPKKQRTHRDQISLAWLQGTWRVVKVETSSGGRYQASGDDLAEIRVVGKRWTFVYGRASGQLNEGPTYDVAVDGARSPAWFDLTGSSRT